MSIRKKEKIIHIYMCNIKLITQKLIGIWQWHIPHLHPDTVSESNWFLEYWFKLREKQKKFPEKNPQQQN